MYLLARVTSWIVLELQPSFLELLDQTDHEISQIERQQEAVIKLFGFESYGYRGLIERSFLRGYTRPYCFHQVSKFAEGIDRLGKFEFCSHESAKGPDTGRIGWRIEDVTFCFRYETGFTGQPQPRQNPASCCLPLPGLGLAESPFRFPDIGIETRRSFDEFRKAIPGRLG